MFTIYTREMKDGASNGARAKGRQIGKVQMEISLSLFLAFPLHVPK
jgi:hypothetical protein